MNVVRLQSPDAREAALVNSFSETILNEAIEAGLLHRATCQVGGYTFQGGQIEPPAQLARWLSLRTLEFEIKVLLVLASDLQEGRALSQEDMQRARLANARVRSARGAVAHAMQKIAAETGRP